jgi:AraC-like DNA-binding protein
MAQRIGVSRRSFVKKATQLGIEPDYVAGRNFYSEGRAREILDRWSQAGCSMAQAGCFVLDEQNELARVEYVHPNENIGLRTVADGRSTQIRNASSLRRLVSTREVARLEGMSRYKLTRLLAAAGVRPVHRHGKTLYWDLDRSREAVWARIGREDSAMRLRDVARRCGVSQELLARKVRQNCICTTGSANYAVDESEVLRIERLDRARRTGWQHLREAGICRVQPRGRQGHEVVGWDVARLIQVADKLSLTSQEALFDEVAWACDGAGQQRFDQSLQNELRRWRTSPDQETRPAAQLLLKVLTHLPKSLIACQSQVALIGAGAHQRYCVNDSSLQLLAIKAGCRTVSAQQDFIGQVDRYIADLLTCEDSATFVTDIRRGHECEGVGYVDEEFVRGAVTLAITNKQPQVGIIVGVEHRAWNVLTRVWDATVVVRCRGQELRLNPYARSGDPNSAHASLHVLLRGSDVLALRHKMQDLTRLPLSPTSAVTKLSLCREVA